MKRRLPASLTVKDSELSCKQVSAVFIETDQVNAELANLSGLKYLTQKFSEIQHLDRSNLVAILLRYKLVAQNRGKTVIDIPLSKLKAIHPINRGASLEKTKARAANISDFVRKNGVPEVITTDIQEQTIKSRMLMRAVKTDDGNYIVFDGNGRLFALREFAENSKIEDIPISIELYDIDYSKIKHLIEIRRKHLYQTGEDVTDVKKILYKDHITDSELEEMTEELISQRKKYSKFQQLIAENSKAKVMGSLANELDVKIRQFENVKRWREFGYGPAFKEGITENEIELMVNKRVPLGFTESSFEQAKDELALALKSEKIESGNVIIDGTSTTFYSNNPNKRSGKHFNVKGLVKSDIDFKIYSPALAVSMRESNYNWKGYESYFKSRWMESEFEAIKEFNRKWSKILGRKVTVIGVDKEIMDGDQYGNFIVNLSNP
ncbi:hypothetical protein [Halobacteriovorax sp. JY17]|uniref:hypothetical protein n=1 Tax=Halobacteriovorax sp. JY17 TaxID=2014617 RepID=UPI000C609DFA|nr:hypothetical protein [Halobacteriovorax sp. JY17]PIK13840.1 MAG: hypothetical protein CES88_12700 [Halobacteriovorax sp. JY17]